MSAYSESAPSNPFHWQQDPSRFKHYGLYKGKIEQRVDPERLGRLRVRIVGIHSPSIPLEMLPWVSPKNNAWQQGGDFLIPPIGETVWVQFEGGLIEYPVWEGGWWGVRETPIGQSQQLGTSANVELPTTVFGGQRHTDGPLKMEDTPGANPGDQPNNFPRISPLGKHIEFDDRKKKQKVVLADQVDNGMHLDCEVGVLGFEVSQGIDGTDRKKFGIVFHREEEAIQTSTEKGWVWIANDKKNTFELRSPRGNKFRIDEDAKRIDLWTELGHNVVLDDQNRQITVATAGGLSLLMDDTAASTLVTNGQTQLKLVDGGMSYFKAGGDLQLEATGTLNLKANSGNVEVNGTLIHLNSATIAPVTTDNTTPQQMPTDLVKIKSGLAVCIETSKNCGDSAGNSGGGGRSVF